MRTYLPTTDLLPVSENSPDTQTQPYEDTRLLTELSCDELSSIALGLDMRMYGESWGTSTTHDEGVDITARGTLKYNGMVIARKATVRQLYHLIAALTPEE